MRTFAAGSSVTLRPGRLSLGSKLALGFEILAAYARVRWFLWRRDLTWTLSALRGSFAAADRDDRDDQLIGFRLGQAVGRALGPLPFDSRCLVRSLVLMRLLARRGIRSSLVIGVRSAPEFAAHAWVESAGIPLLSPNEPAFERLVEL